LFDEFSEFQFVLYNDEEQEVIAEGHTLPCEWDGSPEGLGDGIDTTIAAHSRRTTRDAGQPLYAPWRRRSGHASRAVAWPSGCLT
jgi:hypothetical protein